MNNNNCKRTWSHNPHWQFYKYTLWDWHGVNAIVFSYAQIFLQRLNTNMNGLIINYTYNMRTKWCLITFTIPDIYFLRLVYSIIVSIYSIRFQNKFLNGYYRINQTLTNLVEVSWLIQGVTTINLTTTFEVLFFKRYHARYCLARGANLLHITCCVIYDPCAS